jgi:hypothetical protein
MRVHQWVPSPTTPLPSPLEPTGERKGLFRGIWNLRRLGTPWRLQRLPALRLLGELVSQVLSPSERRAGERIGAACATPLQRGPPGLP